MTYRADLDAVLSHVDTGLDQSLERLFALMRIRSISTDPAYAGECQRAADWLVAELCALGFSAMAHATPGHPIVVAHGPEQAGPHVLFYAHYDVQPVDPVDLWHTDPFEPALRPGPDGRQVIVGRGASDDKGQLLTFIEACRAWINAGGGLPIRVSLILEGEEEAGGANLPVFLEARGDELGVADIALVCDTAMWDRTTPAITTMLRGIVSDEVTIACADRDLHSGMFGNAARNPNQVLAEIIASLRADDGSVAITGFYDQVADLAPETRAEWAALGFEPEAFLARVGLSQPAGERDRPVLETLWARPTCEINGMTGGYVGEGFKTVIPSAASAKISFRLVAGQRPERIRTAFRRHVMARVPSDCTVRFQSHGATPAVSVPSDSPMLLRARDALAREWGRPAVGIGSGGSIPVVSDFKRLLDLDALLIGFAQVDDQVHSPNEKYDLESYHRGIRSWVRILAALAEEAPSTA